MQLSVATGKEISPWNESLGAALENRRNEARKEALRFRLEGQEDARTIAHYQPPTEPLFPPPRDLETVRAILKQNGIHAVSSAYSQLNLAHAHWKGTRG